MSSIMYPSVWQVYRLVRQTFEVEAFTREGAVKQAKLHATDYKKQKVVRIVCRPMRYKTVSAK